MNRCIISTSANPPIVFKFVNRSTQIPIYDTPLVTIEVVVQCANIRIGEVT